MKNQIRYSQEVKERAVCMVFEHEKEYSSQWAAINSIALRLVVHLKPLERGSGRLNEIKGYVPE